MTASTLEAIALANRAAWPARVPLPREEEAADSVRADFNGQVPSLALRQGEHWVSVHSRRDPVRDAARDLDGIDLSRTSTLFVIGLGLGYLLDVLEQRDWSGKVVAFEPSPAMANACLRRRNWRSWLEAERLLVLCGPDYEGLTSVVPTLDPSPEEPVIVVNPVVGRVLGPELPEVLQRAQRAWFGARANQEAKRRNGGRYLLNTLRNAPALSRAAAVRGLVGQFTGVPVILVAAGPSLDRNLHEIASIRDRAIVIAADTALRPLLEAGVPPDLVVAVDPGEANARHLVDLPACPETWLVSEGSVDPEAVRTFGDRIFAFRVGEHHPWPWLKRQAIEGGRLRAWGSVLTTAFDLALQMGCDPIVFTGADLGFTEGRPYARGTVYEEDWRREEAWGRALEDSWAVRVAEWPETCEPGVADVPVRTAPHLMAFRDWLVTESGRAAGRTIVNATGRGILHGSGIRQSSLDRVFQPRPPLTGEVRERIRAIHAATAGSERQPLETNVDDQTMSAWCEFGRVSRDAVTAALREAIPSGWPPTPAPAVNPGQEPPVSTAVAATPQGQYTYPGLTRADAEYVAAVAATHTPQFLALDDPSQPLLAEVAAAVDAMTHDAALVIVDAVGHAAGMQVRKAVDAILCERPEVWVDYRRFTDHQSRITILRRDGSSSADDPYALDAAKWDPVHEGVADRLAPMVVSHYAPRSVIDIGCGAGYWLRAFASLGVSERLGYTQRPADGAVDPEVKTRDIAALLTAGSDAHRRFDACLALEVAQHLPPDRHDAFIAACTDFSDLVVFSSRLPGAPDAGRHARPLVYWARLFRKYGYLLDDRLRSAVEERFGFPRTIYDLPLVFRRHRGAAPSDDGALDAGIDAHLDITVARLQDLYQQAIWTAVRANDLSAAASVPVAVNTTLRFWVIPRWRFMGQPGQVRTVTFRTDAARWYLTDPRASIRVLENGHPLTRVATAAELLVVPGGAWMLVRDELTIATGDGSDPRHNQRSYAVECPGFVAWAEAQALADTLRHGL